MEIKKKTQTKTTFVLELNDWETKDLARILTRVRDQHKVSKSEFSLREKTTGRRILDCLKRLEK